MASFLILLSENSCSTHTCVQIVPFTQRQAVTALCLLLLAALFSLTACRDLKAEKTSSLIVWAWERPEDLRFLPADTAIAVQMAFIEIKGDDFLARGRPYPLLTTTAPETTVIHIEIDGSTAPQWTPVLRKRLATAVLQFAQIIPARQVQIDFEVKQSQRAILLDLLHDVRAGLSPETRLSMTAIASWCNESWLDAAPVDEVVPMLFRMGASDAVIRNQLKQGRDFRDPRCHNALAISTDTPIAQAPAGRRVYIFNPDSWTESQYRTVRTMVEHWQ